MRIIVVRVYGKKKNIVFRIIKKYIPIYSFNDFDIFLNIVLVLIILNENIGQAIPFE